MLVTAAEPSRLTWPTAEHRPTTGAAPRQGRGRSVIPVSARAGIVVTGTEVLTGRVQDRNGPWLADRLLELGVELAHITICGDRPQDIEAQLRFLASEGVDLIVTSGGLGPTADDMTVATVAQLLRPRTRVGRRARGHHRRHPQEADATPRRRRLRGGDGGQSQAGHGSGGRRDPRPGRHRAGRRGARARRRSSCCPGRRANCSRCGPAPWRRAAVAAGDRRPDRVPAGHRPDVRPARVRAGRDAARRRTVRQRLRPPRDHHLPAPRRAGDRHALRTRRRRRLREAGRPAARTPRPASSSPSTAPSSTTRSRRCWRVAPSRRPNPAPRAWSRRG